MKKIITYGSLAFVLVGLVNVANANRMERVNWTDRGLSNPPLTRSSNLDSTIERFWNVSLVAEPVSSSRQRTPLVAPSSPSARSVPSTEVKQGRNTREQRGYFGINLFNAIPLIDFVHGNVTTDSSDHVTGRR